MADQEGGVGRSRLTLERVEVVSEGREAEPLAARIEQVERLRRTAAAG
jgi:hypothetical protein